jgi:hypothetical protein
VNTMPNPVDYKLFDSIEKKLLYDICVADSFFASEFTNLVSKGSKKKTVVEEDMCLYRSYLLQPQYYGLYTHGIKGGCCFTLRKFSESEENVHQVKGKGLLMDDFGIALLDVYSMELPMRVSNMPRDPSVTIDARTDTKAVDTGKIVFSCRYLPEFSNKKKVSTEQYTGSLVSKSRRWTFDFSHDSKTAKLDVFETNYRRYMSMKSPGAPADLPCTYETMVQRLYEQNVSIFASKKKL